MISDSSITILLLDDNPDDRALIKRTLEKDFPKAIFMEPTDARSFHKTLKAGSFDLVITDYQLRWSNGIKILKMVRRARPDCPVLMFTATGSEEIAVSAMKAGLDDYILKSPKHLIRLSASVNALLNRAWQTKMLRKTENALAIAKHEWETIFQAIPHPTLILRSDFTILAANLANEVLIGMSDEGIVGKKCFTVYQQASAPPKDCPLNHLLHSGKNGTMIRELKVMGRNMLISTTPIKDTAGGTPQKYIHISMDITELRRAEREKEALQAQLHHAQKMEAIGTLAGGVAHDFNNILGSIQGFSELAMLKIDDTSLVSNYLKQIEAASHRAVELVKQILLFSRMKPLHFEIFKPNDVLEPLFAKFPRLLGENITLNADVAIGWPIFGDKSSFEQAITNLAINARDAMPHGGTLSIKLENITIDDDACRYNPKAYPGRFVRLSVSDTGDGMDATLLEHIFDPFFTTKEIGKGTGLGLSVVHGIITQQNGWIDVESTPGLGSTFTLYIPASPENG